MTKINSHALYKLNHRINEKGIVERRCTKCQEWKEENIENFYLHNKKKPEKGFHSECKICSIARTKKNTLENHDRVLAKIYDWQDRNKEKTLKRWHDYNEKNKEKQKIYTAEYQKAHPEKMKVYGQNHRDHDITGSEWKNCLKVFDYQCAYCGLPMEKHFAIRNGKVIIMSLHREHVDDEGYNDLRNCTPSCQSCNSTKGGKTIEELLQLKFIEEFTEERYNKIVWWIEDGYKDYIEDKPPYRIIKKKNGHNNKFHHELWTVDEYRNMIECIAIADKKKDLHIFIQEYFKTA